MLINPKYYRKKSPEAVAFELTIGKYTLYIDDDISQRIQREKEIVLVEKLLAQYALAKEKEEEARENTKRYVS